MSTAKWQNIAGSKKFFNPKHKLIWYKLLATFFVFFWCDKAALLFYKRKVYGCHMSQELSRLSNLIIEFANFQLELNNFKSL